MLDSDASNSADSADNSLSEVCGEVVGRIVGDRQVLCMIGNVVGDQIFRHILSRI